MSDWNGRGGRGGWGEEGRDGGLPHDIVISNKPNRRVWQQGKIGQGKHERPRTAQERAQLVHPVADGAHPRADGGHHARHAPRIASGFGAVGAAIADAKVVQL